MAEALPPFRDLKNVTGLLSIAVVNSTEHLSPAASAPGGWRELVLAIGPGVLMAGAAIGGSHLVVSTQAGAMYGWQLLWLMLLVNLFKYPFFLYGPRYTAATGETILHGYRRMGQAYLYAFFILNILTTIMNIAGVAYITASLATNFGLPSGDLPLLTAGVLAICAVLIIVGHYGLLDKVGKVVVGMLAISTLVAVLISIGRESAVPEDFVAPSVWQLASIGFIIAFMGWMPAPIDISVWPSLWMKSREQQTGHRISVRESMIDFHIGYIVTVVLAVFFLALGALILYGSGHELAKKGTDFASQLIGMYTETIGQWAFWIIAISAFTAMFSTTLTCVDGYPRALAMSSILLLGKDEKHFRIVHAVWIVVILSAAYVVVKFFLQDLGSLLSFALAISFITAPFFGWINFKVIRSSAVPARYRPGPLMVALSWAGLAFLSGFTAVWVVWQFI